MVTLTRQVRLAYDLERFGIGVWSVLQTSDALAHDIVELELGQGGEGRVDPQDDCPSIHDDDGSIRVGSKPGEYAAELALG